MADNWSFVVAAYGLAALALGGYWRFLRRREREIQSAGASTAPSDTSPRKNQRAAAKPPLDAGGGRA
jgi:hypothetical protein